MLELFTLVRLTNDQTKSGYIVEVFEDHVIPGYLVEIDGEVVTVTADEVIPVNRINTMEIKIYFNKNFPTSLVNTEVDITKDLEYVGSINVENMFQVADMFDYVFNKCQLDEENLEIKLPRSLSVGDVLSYKYPDNHTRFWMINNVGFKKI